MIVTTPWTCMDCKVVSRFTTREVNSASRIRCQACGSLFLERTPFTQDPSLLAAANEEKRGRRRPRKRRSKTTPEERIQLLSSPTNYRKAVIKGEYAAFKKRKAAQAKHVRDTDYIPLD